jgi:hypothetical protein
VTRSRRFAVRRRRGQNTRRVCAATSVARRCALTTLKEFEEALREQGMRHALAILEKLRRRDRSKREVAPARRVVGRKMTPELARRILELHEATGMTQQEIAFELGVNQGRVNEVIKRGKWLSGDPKSPEAVARDKALARARRGATRERRAAAATGKLGDLGRAAATRRKPRGPAQLPLL